MRRLLRDRQLDPARTVAALADWLSSHPDLLTLAVYSALPGEVDLSALVATHPQRRWVYPKTGNDHQLTFHAVQQPGLELVPGAFGILEPADHLDEVPVGDIDAFICPGLAFDLRGGRLGRGRGYYDRILANARRDAQKIGVCHPFQCIEDTFPQDHDIFMDCVIHG
jgi:5-formyltetrahydrofolate cyclo-ligase